MSQFVDTNKVKEALDRSTEDAQKILNDPSSLEAVLDQVGEEIKRVPVLGNFITELPDMVNLVKCYITKEYAEVSPKVIAAVVGSFLYLIKKKDLIPDSIPVIGILDDVAVLGFALELCKPELRTFREWQANRSAPQA